MTYNGISFDTVELDETTSDEDIKRIAAEVVSSGQVASLNGEDHDRVSPEVFSNFVVDRLQGTDGTPKIFLRPKVPFGADALTVKREEVLEQIKDVSLKAGVQSADLTSALIDLFSDPASAADQYSSAKVKNIIKRLENLLQELKGDLAALFLIDAVRGQKL